MTTSSTPRTISKKMSVTSEIHASGVVKSINPWCSFRLERKKEHDP